MIPALIMGFREGLEAFLLLAIVLNYVSRGGRPDWQGKVFEGSIVGVLISVILGVLFNALATSLSSIENLTKVWESVASLIALGLVTILIIRMIRHGHDMARQVEGQVARNLSASGLFVIALVIVAREGTEIAIFSFAGKYSAGYVALGVLASLILTALIYYSIVKINLAILFRLTLAFLIFQAGFLLGYALHEGLAALATYGMLSGESIIFKKAFDVSWTVLSDKEGAIGIPLHMILGWYSKPEWIQFLAQYLYVIIMFFLWHRDARERARRMERFQREQQLPT